MTKKTKEMKKIEKLKAGNAQKTNLKRKLKKTIEIEKTQKI